MRLHSMDSQNDENFFVTENVAFEEIARVNKFAFRLIGLN
jgi:hypothetical protein